ncbi:17868_t:CDS:2 [Funneliformis geosporum]|nr:17868_t:CDS:2 [Funneliformis geosporum]
MSFIYPLPTTSTISWSDFLLDEDNLYLNRISEATAQRGVVRATLKEAKKTEGPKDYTKILKTIDDYLPYLFGIIDCLEGGQLKLKKEIETSWSCTLSDSVLKKKPHVLCKGIYYELIFVLLTYGYAYADWATSIIENDKNDKNDLRLRQAADLLYKAGGIFAYIGEQVCPKWDKKSVSKPSDVLMEIPTSMSKIALADANSIAIRKALMQQTSSSLLAKLAFGVSGHYEMANGLIKSLKDPSKVCSDFRKYISNGTLFHQVCLHLWVVSAIKIQSGSYMPIAALGKKFLAQDAYEHQQYGKAVGFITEAKDAFHLLTRSKLITISLHATQEYEEVKNLHTIYVNYNNRVAYEEVPTKADLQALIPCGRVLQELTKYDPPLPSFSPVIKKITSRDILDGQYY